MKRIFLAFILLIFCFSAAIFGYFGLKKSCFELKATLESAADFIESKNEESAFEMLKTVSEQWEKRKLVFSVFLDHTTLDTLDSSLPSLSKIFKSGDSKLAFEEIQKSIAVLDDIVEEQKISIANIL